MFQTKLEMTQYMTQKTDNDQWLTMANFFWLYLCLGPKSIPIV